MADLKVLTEISQLVDGFLKQMGNMLNVSLEELQKTGYRALLERIGYQDITYAVTLLEIALLDNIDERELALDTYLTKYSANTYYHAIKAGTYVKAKKFTQAKFNYEQSLKLDPNNIEALNNLARLCTDVFREFDQARNYYERAIQIDPAFTVARLNLGVLLSDKFNDHESAKAQYDAILSYDSNESKGHNNLANYYRRKGDDEKAAKHLQQAIQLNPGYIEAYINYGNLLKVNGQVTEGNEIYKKAKKMTEDKGIQDLLDTLISSTKG